MDCVAECVCYTLGVHENGDYVKECIMISTRDGSEGQRVKRDACSKNYTAHNGMHSVLTYIFLVWL